MGHSVKPLVGASVAVTLLCAFCWHPARAQNPPRVPPRLLQPFVPNFATSASLPLVCGPGGGLPLYTMLIVYGTARVDIAGTGDTAYIAMLGTDANCRWVQLVTAP